MASERGFTLVEVLVVMAVLAGGVLGVLQTTLVAARLEREARAVTAATFLAQQRLERLSALGWERATAGLAVAALPAALGLDGARPQERVGGPAGRFLVVYERDAAGLEPPRCAVACFWEGGDGGFDRRRSVQLATRSSR